MEARVLLNMGVSCNILQLQFVTNLQLQSSTKSTWAAAAGIITMKQTLKAQFIFPESHKWL